MESIVIMLILSLSLGFILILKKDTIPPGVKRPLAIVALVLVAASFVMFVAALYNL